VQPGRIRKKIARLIANATEHDSKESREQHEAWGDAIRLLKKEDHYILVMVDLARAGDFAVADASGPRPRFDQLKLFIAGLLIAAAVVGTDS
jgi:hypothetical protein